MKALVVYIYTDYSENLKIGVSNDWGYFFGDNPTQNEIRDFETEHHTYPYRCNPTVVNIIKVEQ